MLREQNMARVHERTLNLLYRNTRVLPAQPAKPEMEKPSSDRTSYKQLSLTPGENALPSSCFSCLRPSCVVVQTCTSCHKLVGATCVAKCNACPALSCRWLLILPSYYNVHVLSQIVRLCGGVRRVQQVSLPQLHKKPLLLALMTRPAG